MDASQEFDKGVLEYSGNRNAAALRAHRNVLPCCGTPDCRKELAYCYCQAPEWKEINYSSRALCAGYNPFRDSLRGSYRAGPANGRVRDLLLHRLDELRLGHPGHDHAGADAASLQLKRQRLRQAVHRVLRGGIGPAERQRKARGHRGDVDYVTPALPS